MTTAMDAPLHGIRVLDLTRYLSGPYGALLLAEMGAEVVKVEVPGEGDDTRRIAPLKDGLSYYHSTVNRSKASVEIDMKSAEGKAVLRAMLPDFDVLFENFRAGVADRLGFSYDEVAKINPRMVYCSITGFGATGPQSQRAAFDLIVQGETGIMSLNGEPDRPPVKLGLPMADISSGMFAVHGILAALLRRARTGRGGLVEVNMMSSLFSLAVYNTTLYFMSGKSPERNGLRHPGVVPYGPFNTSNGLVLLSTFSDASWGRIVRALDRPELADDPRFDTAPKRLANRDACESLITEIFSGFTSDEVVDRLGRAGIPCGVVRSLGDALESERASGSDSIVDVEYPNGYNLPAVRIPIKFDRLWCPARPAPKLGEDNAMLDRYKTRPEAGTPDLPPPAHVGVEPP